MFIKHIAWFQCTPCGQSGFRSHPPKPATLWMLSQPSPVIVGLWPVSHMFYAGPSPAWTRGGQNTAALPKSGKELNMGIPLETIFIQGSCKCIVYLIPLKPSLGATTWVVVVFFGGQMNIARRMQFFLFLSQLMFGYEEGNRANIGCLVHKNCTEAMQNQSHKFWSWWEIGHAFFNVFCLWPPAFNCIVVVGHDRIGVHPNIGYGRVMKKKAHIGHWQIEDWKQPLMRGWKIFYWSNISMNTPWAEHDGCCHVFNQGVTWRMKALTRKILICHCWIARKDHGLLVEKAWAQI